MIWLLTPTLSPTDTSTAPAKTIDTILPLTFPAEQAKKVTAAFDGGPLTLDGVMLLAMAGRTSSVVTGSLRPGARHNDRLLQPR